MVFNIKDLGTTANFSLLDVLTNTIMNPIAYAIITSVLLCIVILFIYYNDDIQNPRYKLFKVFIWMSVIICGASILHHQVVIKKYVTNTTTPMNFV